MSADKVIDCYDCGKAFDVEDGERLDDDEWRCFRCCDEGRALHNAEQRDRELDDPRRGQASDLNMR